MKNKKRDTGSFRLADPSKITIVKDEHGNNVKRIPRENRCYHPAIEEFRHTKGWRQVKNMFVSEKNIKL